MNKGFKEYLDLKRRYIEQHGEGPPKGTKLDELRKMVGASGSSTSSGCACKTRKKGGGTPSTKRAKLFKYY